MPCGKPCVAANPAAEMRSAGVHLRRPILFAMTGFVADVGRCEGDEDEPIFQDRHPVRCGRSNDACHPARRQRRRPLLAEQRPPLPTPPFRQRRSGCSRHSRPGSRRSRRRPGLAARARLRLFLSPPGPRAIGKEVYVNDYAGGLEPWSPEWYDYCSDRYRSFSPRSGTFVGYDGREHFCTAN